MKKCFISLMLVGLVVCGGCNAVGPKTTQNCTELPVAALELGETGGVTTEFCPVTVTDPQTGEQKVALATQRMTVNWAPKGTIAAQKTAAAGTWMGGAAEIGKASLMGWNLAANHGDIGTRAEDTGRYYYNSKGQLCVYSDINANVTQQSNGVNPIQP